MKTSAIFLFILMVLPPAFSAQLSGGEGGSGGGPRAMLSPEEAKILFQIQDTAKIETIIGSDGQEINIQRQEQAFSDFEKVEIVIFKNGENSTKDEMLQKFSEYQRNGRLNLNGLTLFINSQAVKDAGNIFPKFEGLQGRNPNLGPGIGGGFQGLP